MAFIKATTTLSSDTAPPETLGTMQEPVLWRSRKNKKDGDESVLGSNSYMPTLLGYISTEDVSPTRWYEFSISNYGAEIWRSNPNANNGTGVLQQYAPHEFRLADDSYQLEPATRSNPSASEITPGETGSGAGVGIAAGQGLVLSGNPHRGNSQVDEVNIFRHGPVRYKEYTGQWGTSMYPSGAPSPNAVNALLSGNMGAMNDVTSNADTTFDWPSTPTMVKSGDYPRVETNNLSLGRSTPYAVGCDRVVICNHTYPGSGGRNGKMWIYDKTGTDCIAAVRHPEYDTNGLTGEFGFAVAIADGFIFVSDPMYKSTLGDGEVGKVYQFDLDGNLIRTYDPEDMDNTTPTNMSKTPMDRYNVLGETGEELYPFQTPAGHPYGVNINFGWSIAAGGGKLVVGMPGYTTGNSNTFMGTGQAIVTGGALLFHYGDDIKGGHSLERGRFGRNGTGFPYEGSPGGFNSLNTGVPVAWMHPFWYLEGAFHGTLTNAYRKQDVKAGSSVAISSQYILVGAEHFSDGSVGSVDQGCVMVFDHEMTYLGRVEAPTDDYETKTGQSQSMSNARFGRNLVAQGNTIVMGSKDGWAAVYTHPQYINIHDAISLENGWF
jgi:hypothetical protein